MKVESTNLEGLIHAINTVDHLKDLYSIRPESSFKIYKSLGYDRERRFLGLAEVDKFPFYFLSGRTRYYQMLRQFIPVAYDMYEALGEGISLKPDLSAEQETIIHKKYTEIISALMLNKEAVCLLLDRNMPLEHLITLAFIDLDNLKNIISNPYIKEILGKSVHVNSEYLLSYFDNRSPENLFSLDICEETKSFLLKIFQLKNEHDVTASKSLSEVYTHST